MAGDGAEEVLENGYAPATPPGDNLTVEFVRDMAESWRAYAQRAGDGHRVHVDDELGMALIDNGSPVPFTNPVVLLRPLAANDVIAFASRTTEFFGAGPGGPFGVWSVWPVPDLRPYGFVLGGHPPWMLREPGGAGPPVPEELRILEVRDASSSTAWEAALIDGFPVPELQPPQPGAFFVGDTLHAPRWHHFVGLVNDEPVACASSYVGDRLARVDNVATLASCRGRGYGAALTWAATVAAPDLPAALLASDPGRPVYERLGYRAVFRATLSIGTRAG